MAAADCCPDGVDDCPGEFPWNVECQDGLCAYGGCVDDDDCAIITGTTCEPAFGAAWCVELCDADDDCLVDFGETCSGLTDDGETFCMFEGGGCVTDEDCGGFGVCDADSGSCICADDGQCPRGYACAPLP
jgi:hypothetical protein